MTMNIGDVLEFKFGSELQTIQFLGRVTAFRPFGSLAAQLSPDTVVSTVIRLRVPIAVVKRALNLLPRT